MTRTKQEHIVRKMLDVDIPGKRRRGGLNIRWECARKRDMAVAGLKENNLTHRAGRMKNIVISNGQPR